MPSAMATKPKAGPSRTQACAEMDPMTEESENEDNQEERTRVGTTRTTSHVTKSLGRDVEGPSHPILAQYTMPTRLFIWMQLAAGGYIGVTTF